MMETLQFGLNHKVEFIDEEGEIGTSLVQDWSRKYFLVTIPLKGHQKRLLTVGDLIAGVYYDQDGKVFMFQSRVLDRVVQNIPLYKLSMPDKLRKIQRRDHVRIPVTIQVKYVRIPEKVKSRSVDDLLEEIGRNLAEDWETGTARDLSGGGILLSSLRPFDIHEQILININMDRLQFTVKGKPMRSVTEIRSGQVNYYTGIKFTEISESERDKIIGFVFNEFRTRKQKGV